MLAKKEAKKKRREEEEAHRHKYDLVDEKKLRRANVEMVPNYRFKSIIKKDLAEQAQRLNLFQQMPSHMSKVLIEALNFRRLGVEEFVFRQGEVGTDFNLIISGAVAIFRDDDSSTISATAPAEDAAKTVVSTVSTTDAMKPNTSLVARRHGVCAVVAVNDNQSKKNSDTGSQHEHGTKKTKSSTQTQFICVVRDFDGLGVNALLHGDPYEITAVTVEETILGTLTREAYLQLMELHFPSPFVSPSIELAVRTLPWQRTLRDLSIMADFMNRGKVSSL